MLGLSPTYNEQDPLLRMFQRDGEVWLFSLEKSDNGRFREIIKAGVRSYLDGSMPADTMRWFSRRVDMEAAVRERRATDEKKAADALGAQFTTHGEQLAREFPQVFGTESLLKTNAPILGAALPEFFANPAAVRFADLVSLLAKLIRAGKLVVDTSFVLGGEPFQITGDELRQHPQLDELTKPISSAEERERRRVNELSASEFLDEHPELKNLHVPPLVLAGIKKNILTFIGSNPSYRATDEAKEKILAYIINNHLGYSVQEIQCAWDALREAGELEADEASDVRGQAVRCVDMGAPQKGSRVPAEPSKYSLRQKINSMSSDEFAQRCRDDESFRRAVDELGR